MTFIVLELRQILISVCMQNGAVLIVIILKMWELYVTLVSKVVGD